MEFRINVIILWTKATIIFGVVYMSMDITSEIQDLARVYWSM